MTSLSWSHLPLALFTLCLSTSAQALPTYKDPGEEAYPKSTSVIQRTYDDITQKASTLAGAPNAPTRGTNAPKLKAVPTWADRTADTILKEADEIGGARQAFKTEKNGMPRHAFRTMNEVHGNKSSLRPIVIRGQTPQKPSSHPIQKWTAQKTQTTPAVDAPTSTK